MTYRELQEEVVALGFDSAVDGLTGLVTATNRTVATLCRHRPLTRQLVLTQREPLYAITEETAIDEPLVFEGERLLAVSFESVGVGNMQTREANGENVIALASPEWRERRYLLANNVTRVALESTQNLRVRNLAVFDVLDVSSGADGKDALRAVPLWGRAVRYELDAICPDFVALNEAPVMEIGACVQDFHVHGTSLYLPQELRGALMLSVRRRPVQARLANFTVDAYKDEEIDVASDLADLLPLGVAFYVWLDLEPAKATVYKQMFDEGLQRDAIMQSHGRGQTVISRKGWR